MKNWFFLIFIILQIGFLQAQTVNDSLVNTKRLINADDPSQFITRVEVFNEFQHYAEGDYNINQTVLRGVVTFGKRFTTRLDIPLVYNSLTNTNNQQQTGLGDIVLFTIFFILFWILGISDLTYGFFPGFFSGYLMYSFVHRATHVIKRPPKRFKHLWLHHSLHHYKYPNKAFGVSNIFWDKVFGTMPPKKTKA